MLRLGFLDDVGALGDCCHLDSRWNEVWGFENFFCGLVLGNWMSQLFLVPKSRFKGGGKVYLDAPLPRTAWPQVRYGIGFEA